MSEIPKDLRYTSDHEWVRRNNGEVEVGITDYAQESLGDVTFVELPAVGDSFESGETFGVVESVKAASDLNMPLSGEVIAVNDALDDTPERINEDPYHSAWIIRIRPQNTEELNSLLSANAYAELI